MALQKRDYVAKTGQSVQMFVLSMRATYCVTFAPVHKVQRVGADHPQVSLLSSHFLF